MKQELIAWTLKSGKTAEVTVKLELGRISVSAQVDGIYVGAGKPQPATSAVKRMVPGSVATIGALILMPTERDKINKAISKFEATPQWKAKLARDAQRDKEADEYYRNYSNIVRALNK